MTEPAYDPDKTPGHGPEHKLLETGAPPSSHVPTQELFTDADGQPVYRDKKLSYVADSVEKD